MMLNGKKVEISDGRLRVERVVSDGYEVIETFSQMLAQAPSDE